MTYQADGQMIKAFVLMKHIFAVNARILQAGHPSRLMTQNLLENFRAELQDNLHISEPLGEERTALTISTSF